MVTFASHNNADTLAWVETDDWLKAGHCVEPLSDMQLWAMAAENPNESRYIDCANQVLLHLLRRLIPIDTISRCEYCRK